METKAGLPIIAFPDLSAWEAWLADQPARAAGLWLKVAKAGNDDSALTKAQAIDGALCYGWIDGQIDKYDDVWFLTRFTPRAARSKWSEKNCRRVEELIEANRVMAPGRAAVDAAKADGRWNAAYAPASTAAEPDDLKAALDANPDARAFFDTLTGANRYAILYRIQAAKKPETRVARIAKFVAMCATGATLH